MMILSVYIKQKTTQFMQEPAMAYTNTIENQTNSPTYPICQIQGYNVY